MDQKQKTVSLKLHYATMAALVIANLCNLGLATLFATLYGRSLGYATYQVENNSIRQPGSVPKAHAATLSRPIRFQEYIQAPSNLTAFSGGSTLIAIVWKDNSEGEEGFKIERLNPGLLWTQIAMVPPTSTLGFYHDYGLLPHTTYSYRVRAYAGNSNSDYSNVATATTQ